MSSNTNVPVAGAEPQVVSRSVRKALVKELPAPLRAMHVQVLAQTLRSGVPVRPAALAVVLSAHDDVCDTHMVFTAEHVQELLWFGLAEFCEDYDIALPDGCHDALHALLSVAMATGQLDTAGDSVGDVFGAFRQLTAC